MLFPKPEENTYLRFRSAGQVGMSLRENNQVLLMFSSWRVDSSVTTIGMPVVCNVLMFFLKISVTFLHSEKI